MLRQFRSEVAAALEAALSDLGHPTDDLGIEEPPEGTDATLASSVAFRLAGDGAAPPAVAAGIADAIDPAERTYVASVGAVGPYVNFRVGDRYLTDTLAAAADPEYGRLPDRDESVVVEHTSANPTGPVHVGRARNPIVGDALASLLSYAGYDVDRHYYVNDAGRQVAVFTWAYETFDESELPGEPARDRAEYDLVRYYRTGNEFLETADEAAVEAAEAEIEAILAGLEAGDEATYERVSAVVDPVLGGMRDCLARLPAEFDRFVKETEFMLDGSTREIADRLRDSGHAVREDDAWALDLSDRGIEKELVFLRGDGTSLYTTRDLAHHEWKFDNYDRAVTVLGEDHKLQADQLAAALDLLGNDVDRLDSVHYSWVNLPGGEGMSTREGTGVVLDDLLDEAIDRARAEVEDRLDDRGRGDDLSPDDVDRIARQVGIGAVRYDIVATQPSKAITFRWEDALDFEAQSAPYVQYVHARCCGILDEVDGPPADPDAGALSADEARALVRELARFPAVIERAADARRPHAVATYLRDLAGTFSAFYRECPVLDAAEPDVRAARIGAVAATRHAVANALDVLGIAAPDSM